MTSWLNQRTFPMKKKDFVISSFYEPSSPLYAEDTLQFLYSYVYTQRNAIPFYIYDTNKHFQAYLKINPVLHYLKETPTSGTNLGKDPDALASTLKVLSLTNLRRTIGSVYQFTGMANARIEANLSNVGLFKQSFDAGIVLDISGSVPLIIQSLKSLQKRTGKQTLKVFLATDNFDLLKEFAVTGDKSWAYVSLNRTDPPKDKEAALLKTLSELRILQGVPYLVGSFTSPLVKLVYLTSSMIQMESQVFIIVGSTWKLLD